MLRRESDKACPRLTVNRRLDPAYDACRRATLQRPVAPLTDVDLSITIDDDHHTLKVYAESSAHEVRRVVDTFLHKRWWFDGKLPLQPRFTNDSKLLDDAAGRLVDALFEQQALHGNASNQHLPHEEWLRAPYDYPYESAPTEIDEDLANRSPDDFERISDEEAESYLYPVGEEPGRKLADWIMHWYDPDEKHVYNDMGKRPGTRYETVMPWEHPSRTGVPFPPPDWSPCGTSLEPVDPDLEIAIWLPATGCLRRALRGRRRVRTDGGSGQLRRLRRSSCHLWGEGRAGARPRAPTSSRARAFIKSHLRGVVDR